MSTEYSPDEMSRIEADISTLFGFWQAFQEQDKLKGHVKPAITKMILEISEQVMAEALLDTKKRTDVQSLKLHFAASLAEMFDFGIFIGSSDKDSIVENFLDCKC